MPTFRDWSLLANSTFKQRPALVVQSDSLITGFPQRVMAQITHEPRVGASRVQVKVTSVEGKAMGLLTDSSLVIDKLETLLDTEVIKVIGTCPPQTMTLVEQLPLLPAGTGRERASGGRSGPMALGSDDGALQGWGRTRGRL